MKEDFKNFVRLNPKLISYVKSNKGTWQELFEIYSLYGEDDKVWEKYINDDYDGINELKRIIKNVNLESIKNTVEGLQKVISILQGLSNNKEDNEIYEKSRKYEDLDD